MFNNTRACSFDRRDAYGHVFEAQNANPSKREKGSSAVVDGRLHWTYVPFEGSDQGLELAASEDMSF